MDTSPNHHLLPIVVNEGQKQGLGVFGVIVLNSHRKETWEGTSLCLRFLSDERCVPLHLSYFFNFI